jgi:hypothetical protein
MKRLFSLLGCVGLLGLSACQIQGIPQVKTTSLQPEISSIIGGTLGGDIPPAASVSVNVTVPGGLEVTLLIPHAI